MYSIYILDPSKKKRKTEIVYGIGATNRIGQEIQCLQYAGFF